MLEYTQNSPGKVYQIWQSNQRGVLLYWSNFVDKATSPSMTRGFLYGPHVVMKLI